MSLVIATRIDEALDHMADGARPVAGGTDLVVGARQGKAPLPERLVAIDRIAELATIDVDGDDHLRIGAGVTHARLLTDPLVLEHATAVADAAALVGSPATRHVGTIGGNVMNASPAMDTGAPLVVLGAVAELRSARGTRTTELTGLWAAPGRTTAEPDELCTAVVLPPTDDHAGSAYVRLEYRRSMEIAVVGAAAHVTIEGGATDADRTLRSIRVALTAVAPTIVEVDGIAELVGRPATEVGAEVRRRASAAARPIDDLRAGAEYRRHMVGVMAERAVAAAVRRAAGELLSVPVNRALGVGAGRADEVTP